MVFTVFHYSIPYILHKRFKSSCFSFLILSSSIQDLEPILMFFFGFSPPYNRGFLHSFLAAFTIDLMIALALTPLFLLLIKHLLKFNYYVKDFILKLTFKDVVLGFLCCFLHVLIDSLHHAYNPVFMPFLKESFDKLILFNNWVKASLITQFSFGMLTLGILIYEVRKAKSIKEFVKSILID
ncbi:hypothetical protein KEJ50_03470 [Candidatus Bathyarchaeota archaeon]|nr:hypothetical protein [Candidatus Bathyarchaeota archaeon]